MLVLTRRSGEAVRIGSDIRITVLSTSGSQVRLGIEAPSQVVVHREEVYERIAEANRDAAAVPDAALDELVAHGRAAHDEGAADDEAGEEGLGEDE